MNYNIKFVKDFIQLATNGYKQNWHERNGGNLSYRLKKEEIENITQYCNFSSDYRPIGTSVPKLAGEYFMVTGSGKFLKMWYLTLKIIFASFK